MLNMCTASANIKSACAPHISERDVFRQTCFVGFGVALNLSYSSLRHMLLDYKVTIKITLYDVNEVNATSKQEVKATIKRHLLVGNLCSFRGGQVGH